MKTIIAAALAASIAASQAQASLAWEYNFRSKDWTPIVATKLRTVEGIALIKSLDFSAIAGIQAGIAAPSVGLMVSRSFVIGKGVEGLIGLTGRYVQNRPPQFMGLAIGVKF